LDFWTKTRGRSFEKYSLENGKFIRVKGEKVRFLY